MSETRRLAKAGSREEDSLVGSRRQSKVKYIYRLLRQGDVGESLTNKTVYVLWPDDGTWYKGQVTECDVSNVKATVYYDETEETEECDLKELIGDGQIAFKEPRPASHKCKAGEIGLNQRYFGCKAGDAAREDSDAGNGGKGSAGEEEGNEGEAHAGELEDSDSDVSFSSGELAGRKHKRVSDDSDEEVQLEEFEKREIMRDMSDDEKPLGWRAEDMERKQKRLQQPPAAAPSKAGAGAKKPAVAAPPKKAAAAVQQPGPRRRREAAAGVAAAVHAVAAVQAAVAADVSSDEEPASARKHRQRQAAAVVGEDEDAEAEAYARNLLARVTGKPQPGQKERGAFYGRQGPGSGELEHRASAGHSKEDLRQKVCSGIQQALELVSKEEAGDAGGLPQPALVAEAVEVALFTAYSGTSKEYKQRFRTLQFNLKDPQNPDLRAHVLRGDILPAAFVRMTATELANKELAAYRKAKEEEALKMSVLDAEAAAKFSTAAALDARDQLSIPASMMADNGMLATREPTPEPAARAGRSPSPAPESAAGAGGGAGVPTLSPRGPQQPTMLGADMSGPLKQMAGGGGEGGDYLVSDSAEVAPGGGDEEYNPETAFADDDAKLAAAAPATAALDWAAIKAAAVVAAEEQQPSGLAPLLQPLDSLAAGKQEGAVGRHQHKQQQQHHHHKREHASPLELSSPREQLSMQLSADMPLPSPVDPGSPHSLRHLVLPAADPACLFGKGVWEGQFLVPGVGAFQLSADALAGSGDVAALLGERELEVKGRLALQKLDHFLTELRHSRSRTVTLGLVSLADDCQLAEREALRELIGQYASRGRTGVAAPTKDVEAYLLPACSLTERLVAAARGAAGPQVEALLPGGSSQIAPEQLMLAIIHRRDWHPPYGFVRPVRRPRVHPAPGAAVAEPAAAGDAGDGASASVLPPLPVLSGVQQLPAEDEAVPVAPTISLPEGLDFGAISALAAAFGVIPATAEQQQPTTASPSALIVAPVQLPGQQQAEAAAEPPPPPLGAAPIQMDQLQQLLASLPHSTVVPESAAGVAGRSLQQPAAKPRRSRWESSEEEPQQQAAQEPLPPPPPEQQQQDTHLEQQQNKRRRSRWEGERVQVAEEPQQLASPPAAAAAPASGPMGPMQRASMQRAVAFQQQFGMAAAPVPPQQQFIPPAGIQDPQQQPYQPQFPTSEAPGSQDAPGPYSMPPLQQMGMMPLGQTGDFPASVAPSQMMALPIGQMAGGPPPGGFPPLAGPPMYPQQQQFGLGPPQQQQQNGDSGGGGRWGGRDGGRGRGGRDRRLHYG